MAILINSSTVADEVDKHFLNAYSYIQITYWGLHE